MSTRRDDPTHVVAVTGAVRDDRGRVLLVHVTQRGWELPGGQVEEGEGLLDALVREIEEETGCNVQVERLLALESRVSAPVMVLALFACRHVAGTPRSRDPAVTETAWFTPAEATALVERSPSAERLELALRGDTAVFHRKYRTHPYEKLEETALG